MMVHVPEADVLKSAPRHQLSARYPSPGGDSSGEPEKGAKNPEAWAGLQQQQHAQQQALQPPQPQPLAHDRWQRSDLRLQYAVFVAFAVSAIRLGAGLVLTWKGRTAPGHVLYDYAGPGFWLSGAFVWYPSVIAVWRRVPGAQLRARRWNEITMAAVLVLIVYTVGNFVLYYRYTHQ
ncbi:hypothetical protein L198_07388 [Cryptococcus wingfieldii CBS 7118]|uniref:Uncharacterized protein n=1 Tax=Cryptococcus wingfieldii CBS 7118 TaxID=1295528 RepID=A0A1E3ICC7_9TREE|nr:hypothetical protein L198_07388 [Cryptococcus wingfieldii CBS 7118]ODN86095.1 hypothetical protein L198_07388 [Cryptococcus wingfieldii CBS 7118]